MALGPTKPIQWVTWGLSRGRGWRGKGAGAKTTTQRHVVHKFGMCIAICAFRLYVLMAYKETTLHSHRRHVDSIIMTTRSRWNKWKIYNFTFVWPCTLTNFFIIKPAWCTNFTNLFSHETPHVSDSSLCPSSGVYLLYTQQWYMSHRFVASFQLESCLQTYTIAERTVNKLLMMDRWNCQKHVNFQAKINLWN
jgi:hypothetical protein